jgi:hypothetical protein
MLIDKSHKIAARVPKGHTKIVPTIHAVKAELGIPQDGPAREAAAAAKPA